MKTVTHQRCVRNRRFKTGSLMILLAALPFFTFACDLCNAFIGLNPQFNNSQIGIRSRYRWTYGPHAHNDSNSEPGHAHDHGANVSDHFSTQEIYGRFVFKQRWILSASLPFVWNRSIAETGTADYAGPGDPMVLIQRQVYNSCICCDTVTFKHRLFAGVGLKAPLGRFRMDPLGEGVDPHLQTGTGSWDMMSALTWIARWKKFGLNCDANFRLNTTNPDSFHFANRLNLAANVFYSFQVKNTTFMPNAGVYTELAGMDKQAGDWVVSSGGFAGFAGAGMEVYRGRISATLTGQIPVVQDLHGVQPANKVRALASFGVRL